MFGSLARFLVLRVLGRRLIPVLAAWDVYRFLSARRRRSTRLRIDAVRRGQEPQGTPRPGSRA